MRYFSFPFLKPTAPKNRRSILPRRRGMAVVWLAMFMTVFLGVAALSVDHGFHLSRRAQAQKAADAAALAAAFQLARSGTYNQVAAKAVEYAGLNGYTEDPNPNVNLKKSRVEVIYPILFNQPDGQPYPTNQIMVRVKRQEPRFFGAAFAAMFGQVNNFQWVGGKAVASFDKFLPFSINGTGFYGVENGPISLSMFGPNGRYSNGDFRSVTKLNNGNKNPDYIPDDPNDHDERSGYNFVMKIPQTSDFNTFKLEIFDPDCYNAGNQTETQEGVRVDEYRGPDGTTKNYELTTTRYRLWADNGTPDDFTDDHYVGERIYDGSWVDNNNDGKHDTDMQWVDFNIPRTAYNGQNFRLNVMTTGGASENGFNLRAGRLSDQVIKNSQGVITQNDFENNGTVLSAMGYMPMNFNKNGTANIVLGKIPVEAAGHQVTIRNFDTDVGGSNPYIKFTCDTLPGMSWTGTLSANGTFSTDRINVPTSYKTAGIWRAEYSAGQGDTSVWSMSYDAQGPGAPGDIKLVE